MISIFECLLSAGYFNAFKVAAKNQFVRMEVKHRDNPPFVLNKNARKNRAFTSIMRINLQFSDPDIAVANRVAMILKDKWCRAVSLILGYSDIFGWAKQ